MKRLPYHLLLLTALASGLHVSAQRSFGGEPLGLRASRSGLPEAAVVQLPPVDVAALLAEDEAQAASGRKGPWRFGLQRATDIDLENSGVWHTLPNGTRLWRVVLSCPGALSINFSFTDYVVPEGGRVFVYNWYGDVRGGYTAASNPGHTVLGVAPVPGDRIVVEYQEPAAVQGLGRLTIGSVTHGYRDINKMQRDLGDSGPCNVNVICPEGDDWRDQIRSTVHIIGNAGVCSGTLMNNCANDSTPYFLTANHCKPAGEAPATWVFRFNWDSPTCDPTEQGPTGQTISGSDELVANPGTDMLFLRLSSIPPVEFNAYYSGWDHSGDVNTGATGIHHPAGDIKKISLSNSTLASVDGFDAGNGPADCWQVAVWDVGTTEPGSSGSGLWNNNKQVIGQLYGGQASCANSVNDYYGRLSVSWPLLEEYLGSCGDTLGGFDPNAVPILVRDASITSILGIDQNVCNDTVIQPTVTLKNNGEELLTQVTVEYLINGTLLGNTTWTGNLHPVQTANVLLPEIPVSTGQHTLTVRSVWPNGLADHVPENDADSVEIIVNSPGMPVELFLRPDQYGSDITWTLENNEGTVMYQGGPYQDMNLTPIQRTFCLGSGCYTFRIHDAFGNGICCDEGNGEYTITSEAGEHVVSNGQYGSGETHQFCLVGVGLMELSEATTVQVYPNPTTGPLTVLLSAPTKEPSVWTLRDAMGRPVRTGRIGQGLVQSTIDIGGPATGIYLLELMIDGQRSTQRVLLRH